MVSRVKTVAFQGIEAIPVDVQVMVAPGKVGIQIVGLPDKAVAESRERVQAALHASGLSMPPKKVTVNLAPADLPKEGSHYDLPIALGLMAALGAIPSDALAGYVVLGELSLDGMTTAVAGALPAAMGANAIGLGLICPAESGAEAAWASQDMDIVAARSLIQIANHFRGTQIIARPEPAIRAAPSDLPDLAEIKGQIVAKRALEISAAGGHNLLILCGMLPLIAKLDVRPNCSGGGRLPVLLAIVDGLKGFPEAIVAVFPEATVQTCIVHLLRHSLDFTSYKDRKAVAAALKHIYRAADAVAAEKALTAFEESERGRGYAAIGQSWRRAWPEAVPFYGFPEEVCRIVYTTNAIEALNSKLRRAVRARGQFPTDAAAMKLLFLVLNQSEKV